VGVDMGNTRLKIQNLGKSVTEVRKSVLKRMKYSLPTSGLYHDAPHDEGWRIESVKLNRVQSKTLGSKVYDVIFKKNPIKAKRKKKR